MDSDSALGGRPSRNRRTCLVITVAIETSTTEGSTALFRDGELVFSQVFQAGRNHSSILFVALEKALGMASLGSGDQIVVGLGPGSYAGVRIGIAAAIGLSVATGASLVGIPSVAALKRGKVLALGDARRDTFYFAQVDDGQCFEGPLLLTSDDLAAKLAEFGAEWQRVASEPVAGISNLTLRYPSATRLGQLAIQGVSIVARDHLEPIYLREPYITQPKPRK